MIFTSAIFSLLAATCIAADAKAEAGCKPCGNNAVCPSVCPEATLIQAAQLLATNLCSSIDTNNYALIQTIVTPRSTLRSVFLTPLGCIDEGVIPYLEGVANWLSTVGCPNSPIYTSSYIDEKGHAILFGDNTHIIDNELVSVKIRYTFKVNAGCELSLIDLLVRQAECI